MLRNIDDTIAHELKIAKNRRKIFDKCNERKNNYACRLCVETQTCLEVAKEHEQLAELLKELKFLRQWKSDVVDEFCKYDCNSVEEARHNGYNKAIDDVCKAIEEECGYDADINDDCYFEISRTTLLCLAEQLKAGDNNGT